MIAQPSEPAVNFGSVLGRVSPTSQVGGARRSGVARTPSGCMLAGGDEVVSVLHDDSGPRPQGALGIDAGDDERKPVVKSADDAELRLREVARRSNPDVGHHVEAGVERARPSLDQGVARKRRLPGFMAPEDLAVLSLELGCPLLDGPIAGAHHEYLQLRQSPTLPTRAAPRVRKPKLQCPPPNSPHAPRDINKGSTAVAEAK